MNGLKIVRNIMVVSMVSMMFCSNAMAFGLPSFGGGSKKSSVDVGALTKQQSALVKMLNLSLFHLATAQEKIGKALDMKVTSFLNKHDLKKLKKGQVTGKDAIKKTVVLAEKMSKKIAKELKNVKHLSAKSKKKFMLALPDYGLGAFGMIATGKKATDVAQSLSDVRDFTILKKLASLIFIGQKAPTLISTFTKATGTIIAFAKKQHISIKSINKGKKKMGF